MYTYKTISARPSTRDRHNCNSTFNILYTLNANKSFVTNRKKSVPVQYRFNSSSQNKYANSSSKEPMNIINFSNALISPSENSIDNAVTNKHLICRKYKKKNASSMSANA